MKNIHIFAVSKVLADYAFAHIDFLDFVMKEY
jgi:hypothetical protein